MFLTSSIGHHRKSNNIGEGATSEEEWQHQGGPATSKEERKHQMTGNKIKEFMVWLTGEAPAGIIYITHITK